MWVVYSAVRGVVSTMLPLVSDNFVSDSGLTRLLDEDLEGRGRSNKVYKSAAERGVERGVEAVVVIEMRMIWVQA
jgi:hypothetical protein